MDWVGAVLHLRQAGEPGVMVTVTAVRGHAPRDPGAKMVVGLGRTWGSVGGGNLEQAAVARARELIAAGAVVPETQEAQLSEHAHNAHGRQCCGGVVSLLLEPLPVRPTVALFGLGHVGYELARILSRLELTLHLVDGREAELGPLRLADVTEGVADVHVHHALLGETVLTRLPAGAHVLVMTHDHAEDFALCDAALRLCAERDDRLGSVGLIGSSAKWARFRRNLVAEGHDESALDRITSPVGLPDIAGKDPAVLADSVAAALLQTLSGRPVAAAR